MEGLIRIRAEACVSNPVGADVGRIKASQISGSEDEADAGARRVRVDRHALRRVGCIGELVRIVMVQQPVTSHLTRGARRTGLRNTAAVQVISLCGIA